MEGKIKDSLIKIWSQCISESARIMETTVGFGHHNKH